jgi:hypothetical protein
LDRIANLLSVAKKKLIDITNYHIHLLNNIKKIILMEQIPQQSVIMDKYFKRLAHLATFFNQTMKIVLNDNNIKNIELGDEFVYQLVLRVCKDTHLQKQVLSKLEYFASFPKKYLSDIHLKPKYFMSILKKMEVFINNHIENAKGDFLFQKGSVVNFSFENFASEPSVISIDAIYVSNEDLNKESDSFDRNLIMMKSIIGRGTINEYGIDGFMALLIIYIHDDQLLMDPDNLLTICAKTIAVQFNKMAGVKFKITKICGGTGNDIGARNSINRWIIFLKKMKAIPLEQLMQATKYMEKSVQEALFKYRALYKRDMITTFYTDYHDEKFNELERITGTNFLVPYIKEIYKATTIDEWIECLEKLAKLNDSDIAVAILTFDPCFGKVLLNTTIIEAGNQKFILTIFSKAWMPEIRGIRYEQIIDFRDVMGNNLYSRKWIYNVNFEKIGYKIFTVTTGIENIYDMDGKLLETIPNAS